RHHQVTSAPSSEVNASKWSRRDVPIPLSITGKRKAVSTAPILAKEAAKPAPMPRTLVGKTSPAIKYVMALGPRFVMKLKSMKPAKMKKSLVLPSKFDETAASIRPAAQPMKPK